MVGFENYELHLKKKIENAFDIFGKTVIGKMQRFVKKLFCLKANFNERHNFMDETLEKSKKIYIWNAL